MKKHPFLIMLVVITAIILISQGLYKMSNDRVTTSTERMSINQTSIDLSSTTPSSRIQKATFGTGCFWCTEAIFQQLQGVHSVTSGYCGGKTKNPTYKEVCSGTTGHAEVVQIEFDSSIISFVDLLEAFWKSHDPTTLNRQGNDEGTQYRSAIFYHNEEQRQLAVEYKSKMDASGAFKHPIVTEITAVSDFYPAEKYHQNYYQDNPNQGYCAYVIQPKLEKFKQVFKDKLKKN